MSLFGRLATWVLTHHFALFSMWLDSVCWLTAGIEPCHFCKVAADHLTSIDVKNVTKIRDSLESIKVAVSMLPEILNFNKHAMYSFFQ